MVLKKRVKQVCLFRSSFKHHNIIEFQKVKKGIPTRMLSLEKITESLHSFNFIETMENSQAQKPNNGKSKKNFRK